MIPIVDNLNVIVTNLRRGEEEAGMLLSGSKFKRFTRKERE
jgi:hypothetical protein